MSQINIKSGFRAVTLIELLIAIILLSVVSLGFLSIEVFSRYQVENAQRRAKMQNEVSYALEHISKNLTRAIGNIPVDLINDLASITDIIDTNVTWGLSDPMLRIYIDANSNGVRDDFSGRVAYRLFLDAGSGDDRYKLYFDNSFQNDDFQKDEVIASHIISFVPNARTDASGNFTNVVDLSITACWDPTEARSACGTADNVSIQMQTSVVMPMVSSR